MESLLAIAKLWWIGFSPTTFLRRTESENGQAIFKAKICSRSPGFENYFKSFIFSCKSPIFTIFFRPVQKSDILKKQKNKVGCVLTSHSFGNNDGTRNAKYLTNHIIACAVIHYIRRHFLFSLSKKILRF